MQLKSSFGRLKTLRRVLVPPAPHGRGGHTISQCLETVCWRALMSTAPEFNRM